METPKYYRRLEDMIREEMAIPPVLPGIMKIHSKELGSCHKYL
jgi:hypothetical protein